MNNCPIFTVDAQDSWASFINIIIDNLSNAVEGDKNCVLDKMKLKTTRKRITTSSVFLYCLEIL